MVTNLNDVEIALDPVSGEALTFVPSLEKKPHAVVDQDGDAKESSQTISEAVIKKCSKLQPSNPMPVPGEQFLNDSNIVTMIDDLEVSLEEQTAAENGDFFPICGFPKSSPHQQRFPRQKILAAKTGDKPKTHAFKKPIG